MPLWLQNWIGSLVLCASATWQQPCLIHFAFLLPPTFSFLALFQRGTSGQVGLASAQQFPVAIQLACCERSTRKANTPHNQLRLPLLSFCQVKIPRKAHEFLMMFLQLLPCLNSFIWFDIVVCPANDCCFSLHLSLPLSRTFTLSTKNVQPESLPPCFERSTLGVT